MQRVEARLDVMFRMFTTFISGSGSKAGLAMATRQAGAFKHSRRSFPVPV